MPEAETPCAGLADTADLQEICSLQKYLEAWLKALEHLMPR